MSLVDVLVTPTPFVNRLIHHAHKPLRKGESRRKVRAKGDEQEG